VSCGYAGGSKCVLAGLYLVAKGGLVEPRFKSEYNHAVPSGIRAGGARKHSPQCQPTSIYVPGPATSIFRDQRYVSDEPCMSGVQHARTSLTTLARLDDDAVI
jgi:hypothetical protein